jgi:hypothetical protein
MIPSAASWSYYYYYYYSFYTAVLSFTFREHRSPLLRQAVW